jgi:hydrogenase-4 component E
MRYGFDLVLVLVLLTNFRLLGTSRLAVCIRTVAAQGVLLSLLPLLAQERIGWQAAAVALATAVVKGGVIPRLLFKALREVNIRRDIEPYVGLVTSLILCALGTAGAIAFTRNLPLAAPHAGSLVVPASLATLLSGFLVLTTRRKAITQVVGYLVLENGVFIFGLLLLDAMPFMVEVGALLDIFVGVFVMGIVVNHIRNEFSSLDTEQLSALRG